MTTKLIKQQLYLCYKTIISMQRVYNRLQSITKQLQLSTKVPVNSYTRQLRLYNTSTIKMSSPTEGYRLHHTMLRIKDKQKSIDFYTRLLGMTHIVSRDFEKGKFTLLFFAYTDDNEKQMIKEANGDVEKLWTVMFKLKGHCIELTHNWEHADDFPGYRSGNEPEHKGFGHIAIAVPDVRKCVDRLRAEGVRIQKDPDAGSMKGIAFVLDPDGYWVEVVLGDRSKGSGHEEVAHLKK